MKILFLLISVFVFVFSFEVNISTQSIANGKTVFLELDKNDSIKYKNIIIGKKKYNIFDNPIDSNKLYALIPISYYAKPAHKKIDIAYEIDNKTLTKKIVLEVKDGNYKKETIQVSNSKVNPTAKAVKKRISKEYIEAMKIYNSVSDKSYIKSKFIQPMNSKITSEFGKARVYNNKLNGYHSGIDFRAKVGTPIVAVNDGKVVLAKKRFYSGGTIIIDHGKGIYTCYFHMSKFDVKEGAEVKKAQKIGLSGKSGRVTGPHLHFGARVYGVQVDPSQLITLLNQNFFKDKR